MGYSTDYLGHLDIRPALNKQECDYLDAFVRLRHFDRGGSPYGIPGNPMAPERDGVPTEQYSALGEGKPQLYCQWSVCGTGCCLSYDGSEKFYNADRWLTYLIDHLLAPGAVASRLDHPMLAGFTFDHHLDGVIVGHRRDTRQLFALVVEDNVLERHELTKGDPDFTMLPPLEYQKAIDREVANRQRRLNDSPAVLARQGITKVRAVTRRRGA